MGLYVTCGETWEGTNLLQVVSPLLGLLAFRLHFGQAEFQVLIVLLKTSRPHYRHAHAHAHTHTHTHRQNRGLCNVLNAPECIALRLGKLYLYIYKSLDCKDTGQ
jgi:hypothetical protein